MIEADWAQNCPLLYLAKACRFHFFMCRQVIQPLTADFTKKINNCIVSERHISMQEAIQYYNNVNSNRWHKQNVRTFNGMKQWWTQNKN